jgi:hypothetical protein
MNSDTEELKIRSGRTIGSSWHKKINRVYVTMDCKAHGIKSKNDAIEKAQAETKEWTEWNLIGAYRMSMPNRQLALVIGEVE